MRISLIGPKWNEMVNSYPSLGLGYLAAVAEQEGHECRIHDFGLRPARPLEEEVQDVVDFRPDLVAFTSMTTSYHSVEQAAAMLKEALGVPIVIGGPHATTLPELTLQDENFDYLVFGEGEYTWRDLLQALAAGDISSGSLSKIKGLWFRHEDGTIHQGEERPLIPDLDALPFPARHLFEVDQYPLYAPNGEPMITVLSSRGCPYNCSFCFKGIVGRTYRQRSPENIVAELRQLIDTYHVRNFYFIDDLFTIDVRRLNALLDYFLAQKLDIRWQCLARVDRVTLPLLQKMYQAGCREIHYGIESGNPEILKATAKHINLDQVRQAVEWTDEVGIASKGYFILGLPSDTEETVNETIEFAASLPLTEAMFSIATPFPGTRLWDELVRKHPGTVYNADFTRSYYYNSYLSEIAPFMNISEVSDERLSVLAIEARRRFEEARRHRMYKKSFGNRLGEIIWNVSSITPVRKLGNLLIEMGFFDNFRRMRELSGATSWS
ncbi:MAG TPA: radical SAM protein [Anaerolineae bacterium]|nr:radical SAM protein [Anaerolineae bacterium]HIQ04378.1 radical SAM protein [Anaerolineae bacterium]